MALICKSFFSKESFMNRLIVGNQAPAFTLLNQQENPISLSSLAISDVTSQVG